MVTIKFPNFTRHEPLTQAEELQKAIQGKDSVKVKKLLNAAPDLINTPLPNGAMPFSLAMRKGQAGLVDEWMAKVNIWKKDDQNLTVLDHAFLTDKSLAEKLLQQTMPTKKQLPQTNLQSSEGQLHLAVLKNNLSLLNELLAKGFDPNEQDAEGMTPLLYAIKNRSSEAIHCLLINGANPFEKYGEQAPAIDLLSEACLQKDPLRISKAEGLLFLATTTYWILQLCGDEHSPDLSYLSSALVGLSTLAFYLDQLSSKSLSSNLLLTGILLALEQVPELKLPLQVVRLGFLTKSVLASLTAAVKNYKYDESRSIRRAVVSLVNVSEPLYNLVSKCSSYTQSFFTTKQTSQESSHSHQSKTSSFYGRKAPGPAPFPNLDLSQLNTDKKRFVFLAGHVDLEKCVEESSTRCIEDVNQLSTAEKTLLKDTFFKIDRTSLRDMMFLFKTASGKNGNILRQTVNLEPNYEKQWNKVTRLARANTHPDKVGSDKDFLNVNDAMQRLESFPSEGQWSYQKKYEADRYQDVYSHFFKRRNYGDYAKQEPAENSHESKFEFFKQKISDFFSKNAGIVFNPQSTFSLFDHAIFIYLEFKMLRSWKFNTKRLSPLFSFSIPAFSSGIQLEEIRMIWEKAKLPNVWKTILPENPKRTFLQIPLYQIPVYLFNTLYIFPAKKIGAINSLLVAWLATEWEMKLASSIHETRN